MARRDRKEAEQDGSDSDSTVVLQDLVPEVEESACPPRRRRHTTVLPSRKRCVSICACMRETLLACVLMATGVYLWRLQNPERWDTLFG
jgi:hypothetical protein